MRLNMEDIKKELAELKEMVSKLLEIQILEHNMKYGFFSQGQVNSHLKN